MKHIFLYFIFGLSVCGLAQDRIVMLNGALKTGLVKQVGPDRIIYVYEGVDVSVNMIDVLLIEFKNGKAEIINRPEKDVVNSQNSVENKRIERDPKSVPENNIISVNTLAFLNADASVFYEYLVADKRIGLGAMAAYNFNNSVSLYNVFLLPLSSAKKHYDLGANLNFYFPTGYPNRLLSLGIMLKYTYFTFDKTIIGGLPPGSLISYAPASGYQLSTLFTVGTQHRFAENFIIKPLLGVGAFNVKNDYKKELNYLQNQSGSSNSSSFLLKLYVALNFGYTF